MNVLCVMAHPDDEVLGCGATLAKHAENGDTVQVIVCCAAATGLADAAEALGVRFWANLDYPDQSLDMLRFADLAEAIKYRVVESNVDVIYTHHPGDLNLDHAFTAKAVLTVFRPKPEERPRTILGCEVLSSTEWTFPRVFQPNWYEAVTGAQVGKAQAALECYPSELQPAPHPRSTRNLRNVAAVRGSEIGTDYAQAFQLLRRGPM